MVFNTLSDPYLQTALWTGISALVLTLLCAVQIAYFRLSLWRYQIHERVFLQKWEPIFNATLKQEIPLSLPSLTEEEQIIFLKRWVHLQESVCGEKNSALNALGARLKCDVMARQLLHVGNRGERLLAIVVLGHLRDKNSWMPLLRQAGMSDSMISLYAMWALVQIDPITALEDMAPSFINRHDWSLPHVVNILRSTKEACLPVLLKALPYLDSEQLPRALHIADALQLRFPVTIVAELLHHESVHVLLAALKIVASSDLLEHVRQHLGHPDWRVRVQVARALGRLGGGGEAVADLYQLLCDSQWWVRYRAAHALVGLPFMTKANVEGLVVAATDRFARDMLQQVLMEKGGV